MQIQPPAMRNFPRADAAGGRKAPRHEVGEVGHWLAANHPIAAFVEQTASQEGGSPAQPAAPLHRLGGKLFLDGCEQRRIEN
ncbi:MAG TPA: hypothetical protein VNZ53_05475, partial [Steroidobacteraceae bacterium]|nr:hypothetical protein [Steroidobacteraceae bacterium]